MRRMKQFQKINKNNVLKSIKSQLTFSFCLCLYFFMLSLYTYYHVCIVLKGRWTFYYEHEQNVSKEEAMILVPSCVPNYPVVFSQALIYALRAIVFRFLPSQLLQFPASHRFPCDAGIPNLGELVPIHPKYYFSNVFFLNADGQPTCSCIWTKSN